MRIQITLRSGAQIEADVDSVDLTLAEWTDPATKLRTAQYEQIKWVHAATGKRLVGVIPQEIAAIVRLPDPVPEVLG